MSAKNHWEAVYQTKSADQVSWFQPHAETSLRLIRQLCPDKSCRLIDIGGGASTLVDDLLDDGYRDLSVLDLSATALEVARHRLGLRSHHVYWIEGDVTRLDLPRHSIDIWHDRAVFHFLTDEESRQRYVDSVMQIVRPGGYVIVSTFSEQGPKECSGLPVQRYNPDSLHAQFGSPFEMIGHETEVHQTPFGKQQDFIYCYCRIRHD